MPTRAPNIILVFVDNQPAEMTGCYGNTEIVTPNLDRMAQNGVLFENAYCPNAMCSPCRASVLTGLMPSQHGIHTWLDDHKKDQWPIDWNALAAFTTLPEQLKAAGYETALIGKYHLGNPELPKNGFDHWVAVDVGHTMSFYNNRFIENGCHHVAPEHAVDYLTEKACTYIGSRRSPSDRPFFLFLTYNAPYGHWPSIKGEPDNRFGHLYRDCPMESVPREGINRQLMDWIHMRQTKLPGEEESYYKGLAQIPNDLPSLRNFYSQMTLVDDGVGRVLRQLDAANLQSDTLVIYTADHGMSLGHHGIWGHGEDSWPSNTHGISYHIPLIVQHPGTLPPARRVKALVGTTDVYATILDYVDLDPPHSKESPARSLKSMLAGSPSDTQTGTFDAIFMEQEETRAIRTDKWLYMKRFKGGPYAFRNELYDLVRDPSEHHDVVRAPENRAIVQHLDRRVEAFFARYSDPRFDLWNGGTVKSNSTRPWLWQESWGADWTPVYD
ncbi:MAG: sulfatase-like hydrolase/transferase [Dongiaceae bacterium]